MCCCPVATAPPAARVPQYDPVPTTSEPRQNPPIERAAIQRRNAAAWNVAAVRKPVKASHTLEIDFDIPGQLRPHAAARRVDHSGMLGALILPSFAPVVEQVELVGDDERFAEHRRLEA